MTILVMMMILDDNTGDYGYDDDSDVTMVMILMTLIMIMTRMLIKTIKRK